MIDNDLINDQIEKRKTDIPLEIILKKAEQGNGLSFIETNALFQNLDEKSIEIALELAAKLKSEKKGDIASLYTCLYITNDCVSDCSYCGFRSSNNLTKITLTPSEIEKEAKAIQDLGVTNAILIGGTLPEERYKDLIIEGTKIVKEVGLIPWLEFENLSLDTLKELHNIGANHFILFQETYNKAKYKKIHKNSPLKRDYDARLYKMDEAIEAGFQNIGIGALFGLSQENVFDILGLYHHAQYLQNKGANVCIHLPTLKSASGLSISKDRLSAHEIEKIVTVLRLALPEVSLALSGRENIDLRNRLFPIVDQIGTGGVTNPGGRTIYKKEYEKAGQFKLSDTRTPREVKSYLHKMGIKVV